MRSVLVLMEDVVREEFGLRDLAEVRAAAAERAGKSELPGVEGRVDDFVRAVSQVRRRPTAEVYTYLAMKLVPPVLRAFPELVIEFSSTRAVFQRLDQLLPPVLDVLVPGMPVPFVDVELLGADTLRISFHGPSEVTALLEGVARGLGLHFGERVVARRPASAVFSPTRQHLELAIGAERRVADAGPPAPPERRWFFS